MVSAAELFKTASPSVVLIEIYGDDGKVSGSGSGFVVAADGVILHGLHLELFAVPRPRPFLVQRLCNRVHALTFGAHLQNAPHHFARSVVIPRALSVCRAGRALHLASQSRTHPELPHRDMRQVLPSHRGRVAQAAVTLTS